MWEYKVVYALFEMESDSALGKLLNLYGSYGWELAAVRLCFLIFKRPIPDSVAEPDPTPGQGTPPPKGPK
jgi:hypothetical protein